MKKLRLLITDECPKNCEGCCNRDWDIVNLPKIELYKHDYSQYNEVLITGGEPLLGIEKLKEIIDTINAGYSRRVPKIYVYTSWNGDPSSFFKTFEYAAGICYTIHTDEDAKFIKNCDWFLKQCSYYENQLKNKSLRLNVFKGIDYNKEALSENWKIKDDIEWIKDCPLPDNEIFMRL